MALCLRIMTGKQAGREIPIPGSRFLIGGADNCDLKINASQVGPYHCALVVQDDGIWVRDYGSGTIVGGTRIVGRCRLNHGDQLQVGPLHFELLIEDAPYMPKLASNGSVGANETLAPGAPVSGTSVSAPRRRVIALPRWLFVADWQLNPYVMFALGVWAGIGIFAATVALFKVVGSYSHANP